jgi:hypothetical protein
MTYEVQWLRTWSLVVGIGIGIALLWWPLWAVAAQTTVPMLLLWTLMMTSPPTASRPAGSTLPWRLVAARTFVLGGSLAAGRAFADLSLPVTGLLFALAALSCPPVVRWLDRHVPVLLGRGPDPESAARLEAWALSGQALAGSTDMADRLAVIRSRQSLLDAWEERDPAGFSAWLAAPPAER